MILENQKSSTLEVYGENTSKKATINSSKIAKLQYMLTEGLYSDPLSAVIVEIANNGMDAVIESGKDPMQFPVVVQFMRESTGYKMTVKDNGIGMSKDFFENVFMSMLSSTKENDDTVIGHFGIGGKSWASLGKRVKFTLVKDGKKAIYVCYKGEEFIDFDLILEADSEEENGVEFEMPLGYSDYLTAISKAKQKLAYYDTVVLIIDGVIWDNKIYRNDIFQWSNNQPHSYLHICLKDVIYILDYTKLGIAPISIPIALRFGLSDGITPTPSRENILMNKDTIDKIKVKIGQAATWLAERYNEQVANAENIMDVWGELNKTSKDVEIDGFTFTLDTISKYSPMRYIDPSVKGISLREPGWYKRNSAYLERWWQEAGFLQYDFWQTKRLINTPVQSLAKGMRVVALNYHAVGNVKMYLKQKFRNNGSTLFVYPTAEPGWTWWKMNVLYDKKDAPKKTILEFKEVVRQIWEKILDYRNIETDADYLTWLKQKQDKQKEDRKNGTFKGKTLGKKDGDVTIGWARKHRHNGNEAVFEKKAQKASTLKTMPCLIVYATEESEKFINLVNATLNFNNLKMALIGKLEAKKLPKLDKIVKFEDFMGEKGGKLFGRMCSAILFAKELIIFEKISKGAGSELLKDCMTGYTICAARLRKYVKQNETSVDEQLEQEMLAVAEEHSLFDKQLWDRYVKIKDFNSKYDFLSLFGYRPYDAEARDRYKRVINQMLLFRKKYYNDFEDYDIVTAIKKPLLQEIVEEARKEEEIPSPIMA